MAKSKGSATPRRLSTSSLQAETKKWRCRAYVADWSGVIAERTYIVTANDELSAEVFAETRLLSESFDAAYHYLGTGEGWLAADVEPVNPKKRRDYEARVNCAGTPAESITVTAPSIDRASKLATDAFFEKHPEALERGLTVGGSVVLAN
jgi:hypothetical protein